VQPQWWDFWVPFQWLGLVERFHAAGVPDVVHFTVSFWISMPVCAAVAAFFGVAFGAPTLRLRGDYLAIVTLGFGEIVPIVARNTPYPTNGAIGLNGAAPPRLFGYSFGVESTPYYYLGLLMVGLLIFVSFRLQNSRVGRAWMAIREDEIAVGAMGINRTHLKLLAFAIGAAFGGMTGAFYVAKLQTATPDMFMFPVSVMVLVMIVLGGMGSVYGVVLAAIILQLLQSWFLQDLTSWVHMLGRAVGSASLQKVDLVQSIELIFGIILVSMMLFRRQGLIPATQPTPALTLEQQTALVGRGGFATPIRGIEPPKQGPKSAMIETRKLTRRYGGIVAVKGLDIVVETNSIVALIVANSVAYGFRYGLLTVAGTSTAMVVQLGMTALGMAELLGTLGAWFEWIRWIGVVYLVFLGVAQWRAPPLNLTEIAPEPKSGRAMFTRALLVSLTNPKTLFFYGAFFPQFVVTPCPVGAQIAVLSATFLLLAVLPDGGWALAAGRARRLLTAHGRLRNRISGSLLIGAGVGLALARKS
jgi:ABC-type branched-subunit amino acid transport system permease subunit/threonine/homoserine/homoserine lactone efflux protein